MEENAQRRNGQFGDLRDLGSDIYQELSHRRWRGRRN